MGGLAQLARALGWEVAGCDAKVYPPMSDQLRAAGIQLDEGYLAEHLHGDALIVVGNALSRGNLMVVWLLDRALHYTSGPAWLAEHVLAGRWVLAVSGTHGKTSVSSMLSWLLEDAGLNPGFLIGGVPGNFGVSARLGGGSFFVVEADEYDTAFFDKRAKFVHYRPRTVVINILEFDHADIYPDLAQTYKIALYSGLVDPIFDQPDLLMQDGLHPTAEGVQMIAPPLSMAVAEFQKNNE